MCAVSHQITFVNRSSLGQFLCEFVFIVMYIFKFAAIYAALRHTYASAIAAEYH
jgi:hypothetical protein